MVCRLEADPTIAAEEMEEEGKEAAAAERKGGGGKEGEGDEGLMRDDIKGKGNLNKIECCNVFANGRFAMTGGSGADAKVRIWNLITGKQTKEFSSANGMVSGNDVSYG
jgi:hypothetical protein